VIAWVCVIVALLALFFGLTEALIRTQVEPFDLVRRHREFFFATGVGATSAVFGDSHAARGFTGVDGFVNLASPGEVLARTRQKLALFTARGGQRRVILQVGPHAFAAYRQRGATDPYRLAPWWAPRIGEGVHSSNWFRYWGVVLSGRSFTPNRVLQPDGARTAREEQSGGGRDVVRLAAGRVLEHRPHVDPAATPSAIDLEGILDDLAKQDVEVCLTSFPVSPEYQRESARHPEFERAVRLLSELAGRHGVVYVDQRARFDDAGLFFNPDHLTLEGARQFAPLCVRDCFGASALDSAAATAVAPPSR
jgi:hypothetical protein